MQRLYFKIMNTYFNRICILFDSQTLEFLTDCKWNNMKFNCTDLFRIVATDDGYCCTFNSIPAKDNLASIG